MHHSYNVTALFTSVLVDLASNIIKNKLEKDGELTIEHS